MTLFQHIRLERAGKPGSPAGLPDDGSDIVTPLDADGRVEPERCNIRRLVRGAPRVTGRLRHGAGQWVAS